MRVLAGGVMYGTTLGTNDGVALVTGTVQEDPTLINGQRVRQARINLLDHSDDIQANHPELWGDDYIAGGAGNDEIWGQLGADVIQGDGAIDGYVLYDYDHATRTGSGLAVFLTTAFLPDGPGGVIGRNVSRIGAWRNTDQTIDETLIVHPSIEAATDGDDYIEGNGGNDTIFGGLGQDDIIGDSSDLYLSGLLGQLVKIDSLFGAWRIVSVSADGTTLTLAGRALLPAEQVAGSHLRTITVGAIATTGLVTITSTGLFSMTITRAGFDWYSVGYCIAATCRPAGADLIFGGAGTEISRNDRGAATIGATGIITTTPTGHARDADVIAGDNAQIFRLVGINSVYGQGTTGRGITTPNGFLQFVYDQTSAAEDRGSLRIIVRTVQLLDYTPGGPAYNAAAAATNRGAADEIHGEGGDDVAYGMKGNDVIYGDGQNDDLIGGYGDDWISGGTGDDAILGDDGRISTSRNSSNGWTAAGVACTGNAAGTCYSEPVYASRPSCRPIQTRGPPTATSSTSSSTHRARSRPRRSTSPASSTAQST